MNFIAHDFWSLVWLMALLLTSAITFACGSLTATKMVAIMWINWLCTRALVTFDKGNDVLWMALELSTMVAFLLLGGGLAGKAIAGCFFVIMTVGNLQVLGLLNFSQSAAVADTLGVLSLILIGWTAHAGHDGKLDRDRPKLSLRHRWVGIASSVWRKSH